MDITKLEEIKKFVLESIKTGYIKSDEYEKQKNAMLMDEEDQLTANIEDDYYKIYNYMINHPYKYNYPETIKNFCMLNTIAYYTSNIGYVKKLAHLDAMKKGRIVKRYKKIPKGFILTDHNGNDVKITLISKRLPKTLKVFPSLLDFSEREGSCHINSILLSQCLENKDTFVVTGNILTLNDIPVLHSWIETIASQTGEPLVLDFNTNAIFNKDDYYRIQKPEVITKIPKNRIKHLLDKKLAFNDNTPLEGMSAKEILLFFDDIMKLVEETEMGNQEPQKS